MGLRRVWASVRMGSEELLLRLHLSNSWRFLFVCIYICMYIYVYIMYIIIYSCSSSTVLIDHTCILSVLLRRQLFCNQKIDTTQDNPSALKTPGSNPGEFSTKAAWCSTLG